MRKLLALLLLCAGSAFGQQVSMTWDASATPNVKYNVYRGKVAGDCVQMTAGCTKLTATPITGLTFTDTLPAGGAIYVVRAVDSGSPALESGPSNELVILPPTPPSPPSQLRRVPNP